MRLDGRKDMQPVKTSLVSFYLELKVCTLPLFEGNYKGPVTNTHSTTSDNPIFMHINEFEFHHLLGVESVKNYRQYDKIKNTKDR